MTIRYAEVRRPTWHGAASAICAKLIEQGAKHRQIIWINCHNNGPENNFLYGLAFITAFWDDSIKSDEELKIGFHGQDKNCSWDDMYKNAAKKVETLHPESLISMTGSCTKEGRIVFYVFYYLDGRNGGAQDIRYVESRATTWERGAHLIVGKLKNEGAKTGQIISIDAHSNNNKDVIFSAFWNASLPAIGDLKLQWKAKNDTTPWDDDYRWATQTVLNGTANLDIHSITSNCNESKRGVTYVFYSRDEVLNVDFDLDHGIVAESKPKVIATQTNSNLTSTDQKIIFTDKESTGSRTDNTSSFSHEAGASLTFGTEFEAGVPFIEEGKISEELTRSFKHSWGTETTISNDFSSSTGATTEVIAKPNTKVTCKFIIQEAKLDVPYVIKFISGKRSSGTWNGVSCWDFRAEYTETPIDP